MGTFRAGLGFWPEGFGRPKPVFLGAYMNRLALLLSLTLGACSSTPTHGPEPAPTELAFYLSNKDYCSSWTKKPGLEKTASNSVAQEVFARVDNETCKLMHLNATLHSPDRGKLCLGISDSAPECLHSVIKQIHTAHPLSITGILLFQTMETKLVMRERKESMRKKLHPQAEISRRASEHLLKTTMLARNFLDTRATPKDWIANPSRELEEMQTEEKAWVTKACKGMKKAARKLIAGLENLIVKEAYLHEAKGRFPASDDCSRL